MGRVCDDDGQVICEEGEVRKRWRDYFATLLQSNDQPQQGVPHGDAYGAETVEEADEEITLEEVRNRLITNEYRQAKEQESTRRVWGNRRNVKGRR